MPGTLKIIQSAGLFFAQSKQHRQYMRLRNINFHASHLCDLVSADYKRPMTRPQIERWIKIFIVALVATFVWTVTKVLEMVGVM